MLVVGTDGVGTKLKVAFLTGRHDTVGIDLVAMSVNDMVVCGAEPLFFLDYFATGKLDVGVAERVVAGIAEGCQAGRLRAARRRDRGAARACTPTASTTWPASRVGVVEKSRDRRRRARSRAGDAAASAWRRAGLHSNGYSLARRVLLEHMKLPLDATPPGLGEPLATALLRPTRIYVRALRALHDADLLRGAAHITGGGLVDNPPRMLPDDARLRLRIDLGDAGRCRRSSSLLARGGDVADAEMRRTFNMGIGMVVVRAGRPRRRGAQTLLAARRRAGVLDRRGRSPADAP